MKFLTVSDLDGRVGAQYEVSDALAALLTDLARRITRNFVEAPTGETGTGNPPGVAPIGSFSWALERLKAGARVLRRGWNGKGLWIVLVPKEHWGVGSAVPFNWGDVRNHLKPWIGMKTTDNGFVPWLASQTDLLADDWEEFAEATNPRRDNPPEPGREWA